MEPEKINVYGASGHAKVIIDILNSRPDVQLGGLFDDNEDLDFLLDHPIVSPRNIRELEKYPLLIAIGDNRIRKMIDHTYGNNVSRYVAHSSAIISSSASIAEGTVIHPKAVVNSSATIGRHAIINSGAIVEHDCEVENFAHISPGAVLAGNVKVGQGTHIGAGAVVIPGIKIGKWCTIGAGSVIIRDVPDYAKVVGNPGRVLAFAD